jgi:hypothetical protein
MMEVSQTDDLARSTERRLTIFVAFAAEWTIGLHPPSPFTLLLGQCEIEIENKIRNSVSLKFCEAIKCLEVMLTNQGLVEHGVPCREWTKILGSF